MDVEVVCAGGELEVAAVVGHGVFLVDAGLACCCAEVGSPVGVFTELEFAAFVHFHVERGYPSVERLFEHWQVLSPAKRHDAAGYAPAAFVDEFAAGDDDRGVVRFFEACAGICLAGGGLQDKDCLGDVFVAFDAEDYFAGAVLLAGIGRGGDVDRGFAAYAGGAAADCRVYLDPARLAAADPFAAGGNCEGFGVAVARKAQGLLGDFDGRGNLGLCRLLVAGGGEYERSCD